MILADAQGRVLLVRHNCGLRRWSLPGGVVEDGETPAQAAVREAQEEVGVTVRLGELVGTYLTLGAGRPDVQSFVYVADSVDGAPELADPTEIAALGWFSPATLPDPMTNDGRPAMLDYAAGRRAVHREIDRTS